jgi:hypothetical protein
MTIPPPEPQASPSFVAEVRTLAREHGFSFSDTVYQHVLVDFDYEKWCLHRRDQRYIFSKILLPRLQHRAEWEQQMDAAGAHLAELLTTA